MEKGILMNKYELRTNKKKEAIVNSALALFSDNGFQNTSIKQIADKAKVSQVSIYNYFGSKDALVTECAKIIMKNTLEKAKQILDEPIGFIEKLNKALSLCTGEIHRALNEYFSTKALDDKVFLSLLSDGLISVQCEIYEAFLEAGKEEGAIDKSIPTEVLMKYILAFNQIPLSAEHYKAEVDMLHQLFLYGLLGKKE